MADPEPTPVRYDLNGGWLHAALEVSAAPEAVSFAYFVVHPQGEPVVPIQPPIRGADNEVGRSYRVPGPTDESLRDVLDLLNGMILEAPTDIMAGEGGSPVARLVLFQDASAGLRRLGEAEAEFGTGGSAVAGRAVPRILLVGTGPGEG